MDIQVKDVCIVVDEVNDKLVALKQDENYYFICTLCNLYMGLFNIYPVSKIEPLINAGAIIIVVIYP